MSGARVIAGASAATGLGVLAVVLGVQSVEGAIAAPRFSLRGERFDLSTMQGRFARQLSNCDPATLLAREPEIRRAQALLERFGAGKLAQGEATDAQLWAARKLVESAVHPDTKEIIPEPFRMAGYVPFNGPVCVAMMASSSTPALLFWNWVNQSQNALVNYSNRNASSPTSNETLAMSYASAVGAALTVAFGLSQFITRRFQPAQAAQLMKFVAFPSSIVASCSNCYIMRRPEIESGVLLQDKEGNTLAGGKRSSVAARKAVEETVMSRALLQVPVFFLPAATMSLPPVAAFAAANPALGVSLTTLITMIGFGFGLPAAVAYFPQLGSLKVSEVEPEIAAMIKDKTLDTVYYNKGL
jgi:tricarboxylate carrier